jgi:hypothetical protein
MLLPMVGGASRATTPSDVVRKRALVHAVGDPVEVSFDAADVVALLVQRLPLRGVRDRCVVGGGRTCRTSLR